MPLRVETTQVTCPQPPPTVATGAVDDEPQRLTAMKRYGILDILPDDVFDRITALAADIFNVPISIISIVDHDRVWLESYHGLNAAEPDQDPGAWESAILSIEPSILTDARTDIRAIFNPLVVGGFDLHFYVGVLLRGRDGCNLGTLCVIDREPRQIDERQIRQLKYLASIVMDQMELRLSARRAAAQAGVMASEIDHRMMNSLQFISSLLKMQSRTVSTAEAVNQLMIAANRVSAVARVHRHFSADEAADQVPILAYLRRLCGELSDIMEADIEVDGFVASVPTKQIFAIGLIVKELVTNAKKHGAGSIKITFTPESSGQYQLCVADEGEDLPEGFGPDRNNGNGLGMKVVTALVSQLGGQLSASRNLAGRGACFTITLPGSIPIDVPDSKNSLITPIHQ